MKSLFVLALLFALPYSALAAARNTELIVEPEHPRPNQPYTVRAYLKQGVPAVTTFRWSVDGEEQLAGVGADRITLVAPRSGVTTRVSVSARVGSSVETVFTSITPGSVALTWNALTTVPPLYRGRALPVPNSSVRVFAHPSLVDIDGNPVRSSTISYTWYVNNQVQHAASGVGKSSFVYTFGVLARPVTITVIAESPDGSTTATDTTTLGTVQPQMVMYEQRALEGILLNKAIIRAFDFTSAEEVEVLAYPLYAANQRLLTPRWTIDGTPFEITGNPWLAVFKKTSSENGVNSVEITATHPTDFQAKVRGQFLLQY